jgi:carbamoyltransferase
MKFIGYNGTHDASIVIFNEEGNLEFYAEAERFGRREKQTNDLSCLLETFPDISIGKNDLISTIAMNQDSTATDNYDDTLVRKITSDHFYYNGKKLQSTYVIDHHLAHAISSWCFRPDDAERLFLAYDGAGYMACPNRPIKSSLVGTISDKGFHKINDATPIISSMPVATMLGGNTKSAGKAMGLAGYFPDISPMQPSAENLLRVLYSTINEFSGKPQCCLFGDTDLDKMKFVASFYKFMIQQIWKCVEENLDNHLEKMGVVIGGGTALALEINTKIHEKTKGDLVFGPPTSDSGLALGAAAFACFHTTGKWPKLDTPSLQVLQKPLPKFGPQEPKEIAQLIAKNEIVGLLRDKAEAGPRALGFRSVLASATKKENLKLVSEELKERQFYQPLAPMVTEEAFDRYFIGPKGRYMQYRVECTKEAQKYLSAIVHKDNSARPQVVSKSKDPWLHELLVECENLIGHPCLINTSLNSKGKPICNSLEDAIEDFKGKNIELVSIKNQK